MCFSQIANRPLISFETNMEIDNSYLCESIFDLIPDEMRTEIFAKLVEEKEWNSLLKASKVNWRWKVEIDELWRKYCESNSLLQDEEIWGKKGKNWKWVCICLSKIFDKEEAKEGAGCTGKTVVVKQEARYEGEWKENKKDGVGRIWWSNGDRYLGDWKNDCKEGYGFMIWENGDRYEGGWKNDLREGEEASYSYANGGTFRGTYTNDERHGKGAFYWPDGDHFEGEWKSGGRNGKGVLVLANGTRYEQEWNESPYVNYSDTLPAKFPPGNES